MNTPDNLSEKIVEKLDGIAREIGDRFDVDIADVKDLGTVLIVGSTEAAVIALIAYGFCQVFRG